MTKDEYEAAFQKGQQAARHAIDQARQAGRGFKGQALSWFRREDWPQWREIDPDLEPDFDYWQARSDGAFAEFQAAGVPVLKVVIDPDEFLAWSRAKRQPHPNFMGSLRYQISHDAKEADARQQQCDSRKDAKKEHCETARAERTGQQLIRGPHFVNRDIRIDRSKNAPYIGYV